MRTKKEKVTFNRSFRLTGIDVELPADTYVVETDEEEIGGMKA